MVDNRRWNTAQVLISDTLERPSLQSRCEHSEALAQVVEDEAGDLRAKLVAGGIEASMYYGYWRIWKHANGYDGELMQYRELTEHFENAMLDAALATADRWYGVCYG